MLQIWTQVLTLTLQHVINWTIFHLQFIHALDRITRYNPGRLWICSPPACASRVPRLQYRNTIHTTHDFEDWEPILFPSFQGLSFLPCTASHFQRVCLQGTMWHFPTGTWTIGYPVRQLTCGKFMRAGLELDLVGRTWAVKEAGKAGLMEKKVTQGTVSFSWCLWACGGWRRRPSWKGSLEWNSCMISMPEKYEMITEVCGVGRGPIAML